MPSCLAAISGGDNRLGLPRADRAIVVLVDGLGAAALKARAGHARTLMAPLTKSSIIDSGFPTTTASALATLTTGTLPGQHGLVGFTVLDTVNDRLLKQLSGWDSSLDPVAWQPMPTVFETAIAAGLDAVVIAPERYRDSGFTHGVLRGAAYVGASSITDRVDEALAWAATGARGIAYLYIPELDMAGHAHGWESSEWISTLESVDAAIRTLEQSLAPGDGLLVTADHGVLDIPEHGHIHVDGTPALLDGVRFLAGEPRCLQVHFEKDALSAVRESTLAAWRAEESDRAWVATRDDAIAANWFGEVRAEVAPRIGDILVAARKDVAYYDSRLIKPGSHGMIGQHGSFSPAETKIPVLRYGAFSRI
ncbi:alkaline phosphatase family protein [Glaciihabitans arcticus]|nr:nucleotide pyrophosphatase/phosphodiesterase family protein [Glaciihabitans arcticus]